MRASDVDGELERILHGRQGRKVGDEIKFLCPAHDDHNASAEWNRRKSAWNCPACGAGGTTRDLAERLGIHVETVAERAEKAQIVATYDYTDEQGELLYQVVRLQPKDFRQRRPDGQGGWIWKNGQRQVLYRLQRLQGRSGRLYWPEGEKDVDNLERIGALATTSAGGAVGRSKERPDIASKQKWFPAYGDQARPFEVVFLRDNDQAGADYCAAFAGECARLGIRVRVLELPELPPKGDVSDWLAAGGTLAELDHLADECPEWSPPAEPTGLAAFETSDAGSAELLAHLYGNKIRFDHARRRWLIWGRHIWEPDRVEEIKQLAIDAARQRAKAAADLAGERAKRQFNYAKASENAGKIAAALDTAQSHPVLRDAGAGWDSNPLLLGCENGVINLTTGELRAGRQDDRITRSTRLVFDPNAQCPRWEQFLLEVFEEDRELIEFIQRAVGYSLTGSMRDQVWFYCYGKGENGKSKFFEVLQGITGDYTANMDAKSLKKASVSASSGPSSDLARLAGMRLVTTSEIAGGGELDSELVKKLTHGDRMTARFMRENEIEFTSAAKLWAMANDFATTHDTTRGFWRGVRVVPFNRSFAAGERDEGLSDKLRAELPGILAWAVRGAVKWHQSGLATPETVLLATEEYRERLDTVQEFIANCCTTGEWLRASSADLQAAFRAWNLRQGVPEKELWSATRFGRELAKRFKRTKVGSGSAAYVGLGLLLEDEWGRRVTEGLQIQPEGSEGSRIENENAMQLRVRTEKPSEPSEPSESNLKRALYDEPNPPNPPAVITADCDCDDPRHERHSEPFWQDHQGGWHCGCHPVALPNIEGDM